MNNSNCINLLLLLMTIFCNSLTYVQRFVVGNSSSMSVAGVPLIEEHAVAVTPKLLDDPTNGNSSISYYIREYARIHPSPAVVEYSIEEIPKSLDALLTTPERTDLEEVQENSEKLQLPNQVPQQQLKTQLQKLQKAEKDLQNAIANLNLRKYEIKKEQLQNQKNAKYNLQKQHAKDTAEANKQRAEAQEVADEDNADLKSPQSSFKTPIYFISVPRFHRNIFT